MSFHALSEVPHGHAPFAIFAVYVRTECSVLLNLDVKPVHGKSHNIRRTCSITTIHMKCVRVSLLFQMCLGLVVDIRLANTFGMGAILVPQSAFYLRPFAWSTHARVKTNVPECLLTKYGRVLSDSRLPT